MELEEELVEWGAREVEAPAVEAKASLPKVGRFGREMATRGVVCSRTGGVRLARGRICRLRMLTACVG